jgi:uncharacterized membrane protein (UPF0127 family)
MKFLMVLLVALAFVLGGCGGSGEDSEGDTPATGSPETSGFSSDSAADTTGEELRTLTINTSGGEEVEVRVEIADNTSERAKGLMNRTALPKDQGMLFVFDSEQELSFWMSNTLIPLSIAYMDSEGRIVDIQDMEPLDDEPPHYVSAEPAQYALEVNQGFFEERGVEVGDTAELPV